MSFPISRRISLLVRFVPSAFRLSVFKSVSSSFGPSSASSSGYALRIEQVSGPCQTLCPLRKKCWQRRPDCRTNDLNASLRIWILQPCLLCAFLRFEGLGQGRELPADVFEEKPPLSDFGHERFIARGAQRCGKSRQP